MIEEPFLRSFAFPCLLLTAGRRVHLWTGGALFPPPPGTQQSLQLEAYIRAKDGWSLCPAGYALYASNVDADGANRVVVYGLKVPGLSKVHGKSDVLSITAPREAIEAALKASFSSLKASEGFLQSIVISGVHEIRNINKDLYNAIYELRANLEQPTGTTWRNTELARNVEALSELLKVRADVFDVISNPTILAATSGRYQVYKSFDRIRKSLTPSAATKKLQLRMQGSSNGRTEGSKLFDVIPYVLIQNAIKYSPRNGIIIIEVQDTNAKITVHLSCHGPAVEADELPRIFSAGYRGKNASRFEPQGSGIGLFLLQRLLDQLNGASIRFSQEPAESREGDIPFAGTHFHLEFPLSK